MTKKEWCFFFLLITLLGIGLLLLFGFFGRFEISYEISYASDDDWWWSWWDPSNPLSPLNPLHPANPSKPSY